MDILLEFTRLGGTKNQSSNNSIKQLEKKINQPFTIKDAKSFLKEVHAYACAIDDKSEDIKRLWFQFMWNIKSNFAKSENKKDLQGFKKLIILLNKKTNITYVLSQILTKPIPKKNGQLFELLLKLLEFICDTCANKSETQKFKEILSDAIVFKELSCHYFQPKTIESICAGNNQDKNFTISNRGKLSGKCKAGADSKIIWSDTFTTHAKDNIPARLTTEKILRIVLKSATKESYENIISAFKQIPMDFNKLTELFKYFENPTDLFLLIIQNYVKESQFIKEYHEYVLTNLESIIEKMESAGSNLIRCGMNALDFPQRKELACKTLDIVLSKWEEQSMKGVKVITTLFHDVDSSISDEEISNRLFLLFEKVVMASNPSEEITKFLFKLKTLSFVPGRAWKFLEILLERSNATKDEILLDILPNKQNFPTEKINETVIKHLVKYLNQSMLGAAAPLLINFLSELLEAKAIPEKYIQDHKSILACKVDAVLSDSDALNPTWLKLIIYLLPYLQEQKIIDQVCEHTHLLIEIELSKDVLISFIQLLNPQQQANYFECICSTIKHEISTNRGVTTPAFHAFKTVGNLMLRDDAVYHSLKSLCGTLFDFSNRAALEISVPIISKLLDFSDEEKQILENSYSIYFENQEQQIHEKSSSGSCPSVLKLSNKLDKPIQLGCDLTESLVNEAITTLSSRKNDQKMKESEYKASSLVFTSTTMDNISKIKHKIDSNVPILLEGDTGVGKTAIISELASQWNNQLIRFNMSAQVSIDELLGSLHVVGKDLVFTLQPFSKAYVEGYWLLLDELNLAPDIVLQRIESALDSNILQINNPTLSEPNQHLPRHKDFRLFATQNPNTGLFKGKRETLSASLLDRFIPIIFNDFTRQEYQEIVKHKMEVSDNAVAEIMVKFHFRIKEMIHSAINPFPEQESYSVISIRELIKWVEHYNSSSSSSSSSKSSKDACLVWEAWCIYGARFRHKGRNMIVTVLKEYWPEVDIFAVDWTATPIHNSNAAEVQRCISIGNHSQISSNYVSAHGSADFNQNVMGKVDRTHDAIVDLLTSYDIMSQYGLYQIDERWKNEWSDACKEYPEEEFGAVGAAVYTSKVRSKALQETILRIFTEQLAISCDKLLQEDIQSELETPFVLTPRVLFLWKQIIHSLTIKTPTLIIGPEGCGKSEAVLALAYLLGNNISTICITPETETSALIGQFVPSERFTEWYDGGVTEAFKGGWALLDNINNADAEVLERLNPILEQPPHLILTEKGETDVIEPSNDYRLFATMTPPEKGILHSGSELSPALYNRFSCIWMSDLSDDCFPDEFEMFDELEKVTACLLGDENIPEALDVCELLLQAPKATFPNITFRNIIRLLDNAYKWKSLLSLPIAERLVIAYRVTFGSQIKSEEDRKKLEEDVLKVLQLSSAPSRYLFYEKFIGDRKMANHILTASRKIHAEIVLACCYAANLPILLEGPAAVGKTSLIQALVGKGIVDSKLERVNNTQSTSVQDYIGSYLPIGGSFVFQEGALYRAMKEGSWFLADEFNLAEPAVLNMLFPLLEGKRSIKIPGSKEILYAHPGFRFIATQNDTTYANRNELSKSLRNRFIELQVEDFPKEELAEILLQRKYSNQLQKPLPAATAHFLAKLYTSLRHSLVMEASITTRELIRWISRGLCFGEDHWDDVGRSLLEARQIDRCQS